MYHKCSKRMREDDEKGRTKIPKPTNRHRLGYILVGKICEFPILSKTLPNLTTIPTSTTAVETSLLFQQLFRSKSAVPKFLAQNI